MKKICLVLVGLYLILLSSFAQTKPTQDSIQYKSRKLVLEEVNFVSSYYHQDGDNSSVTGGIGTQKLSDFANIIDIKFAKYDKRYRKHTFTLEGGIDSYSSASSDKIDLTANSSASSNDIRIYPSVSWLVENDKKRTSFGITASASKEFDYQSFGMGINFSKKSINNNREIGFKAQAYLDQVSLILPIELRTSSNSRNDGDDYPTSSRNSLSGSITYSQIINQKLQLLFLLDLAWQKGFLSLPFHRVYMNNNTVQSEVLPSSRLKIPVGLRANYFLGDNIVIRSFYRFYQDDWGLTSHSADLETAIKITPFFSVSPFYRYYRQSSIKYFEPYQAHSPGDKYYTSNYDYSKFDSHFIGAGFRMAPPRGVFGNPHFSMIEIRYGHYLRSTNFNSNIISLHLQFK
jgi:hypothetical protein